VPECPFEHAEWLAVAATKDPKLIPEYKAATSTAMKLEGAPGWKGTKTKMTQVEKILDHIKKNGSISQREAYIDHSIQSFHRRLSDIREMGIELIGVARVHPVTGQEYTRYSLVEGA